MIDTHCHLNFDKYDADRDAIIDRGQAVGVTHIINPGVDIPTSQAGLALSQQYDGVYAAVGVHPNNTSGFALSQIEIIRKLANAPKVIAIGEIGLDYYWDKSPREQQIEALEAQLTLASEMNLPVIIHNREASDDIIDILESWAGTLSSPLRDNPGVLHSFSAPIEIAQRALAAGFYLGFTGPLTYKNADDIRAAARITPRDRILTETDGPFLTPVPHRGKRNEPAYIPLIVDRLASLHQLTIEEMAAQTFKNACTLFKLPVTVNDA